MFCTLNRDPQYFCDWHTVGGVLEDFLRPLLKDLQDIPTGIVNEIIKETLENFLKHSFEELLIERLEGIIKNPLEGILKNFRKKKFLRNCLLNI